MIDIAATVIDVQAHHADQFLAFVHDSSEGCELCGAELRFQVPNTPLFEGHYVVDFFVNEGPRPGAREVITEPLLGLVEQEESIQGLRVRMAPFAWEAVRFEWESSTVDDGLVAGWFDRWVDPNDARYVEGRLLGEIAHSLMIEQGGASIDFGSAPPQAFWDWLEVVRASGIASVTIGSDRRE